MSRALVPVATGIALRNVLRTGLPEALAARGLTPVFAVPRGLHGQLGAETHAHAETFATLPEIEASRWDTLLGDLAFGIVHRRCAIATIDILRRARARRRERTPWKERLSPLLGRSWTVYRGLRALRRRLTDVSGMDPLIDAVRPDVVFANNVFNHAEAAVLRRARERGIPAIGMVHSWDNPSTKGDLPVHTDRLLVWSDAMAAEMSGYFRVPDQRMPRVGSPQFDVYAQELPTGRGELLARYGFVAGTRIIVYASGSPGLCPTEPRYPEMLLPLLAADDRLALVVRLHPRDRSERYVTLEGRRNVRVETAGRPGAGVDDRWNPTDDDHLHLAALMRYADVVVNVASTIALDAAANDTPSVHVGFDAEDGVDYLDSVTRFFEYTHIRRAIACGAAPIARDPDELRAAVRHALEHPEDRRAQRRTLALQEGFDGKGLAAARIAAALALAAGGSWDGRLPDDAELRAGQEPASSVL